MPTLSADLELLVDQALTNVQQIDDELTRIASNFSEALAAGLAVVGTELQSVEVTADVAPAEAEVQSLVQSVEGEQLALPVDADTTAAAGAVSDLVGAVDGESAEIHVDADTTDAQAAVDDLSGSVNDLASSGGKAQGAMHGTGISAGELGGLAGLATGEVKGLGEASGIFGEHAGVAAGGALALGVGIAEIAKQGFNAVSAEERFNTTLGDQAEAVKNVQVGSLTTDLFKLGGQFGSTDAAMQNATSSVFQFAVNSGASRSEATQFADGIAAISARAVALNPNVGTTADVMERAAIGIGRTRTAAGLLNVGLSTMEVNTLAAKIAQDKGESSATAYDKSVAALQISVERFGPSLKANIADGAENAANKTKAATAEFENAIEGFAKPLVAPSLDLIKAALPAAEDLGQALADIASVAIPLLTGALDLLGPAIEPVLAGFVAFKAFSIGSALVGELVSTAAAWGFLGASAQESELAVRAASEEMAADEAVATDGLSLVVAAAVAAGVAIASFGGSTDNTSSEIHKMSKELEGLSAHKLVETFNDSGKVHALGSDISETSARLGVFKDIANDNVGTAQRLLDELDKEGASTKGYQKILDDAVKSQQDQTQAQKDTKAAGDGLLGTTDAQASSTANAAKALDGYKAGTVDATSALKVMTDSQKEENDALTIYKQQLEGIQGLQGDVTAAQIALGNAEQSGFEALQKNGAQFDINTQAGRDNVSALQQQVSAVDALAEATLKQTGNQSDADKIVADFTNTLDTNLTAILGSKDAADAVVVSLGLVPPAVQPAEDTLGDLAKAFGGVDGAARLAALTNQQSVQQVATDTSVSLEAAGATAVAFSGQFSSEVGKAGTDGSDAFGTGIGEVPGKAGTAVDNAGTAIGDAGARLSAQGGAAFVAGLNVGDAFDQGMADGITTFSFVVSIAAAQAVADAEAAARTAAKSKSPSQLFAEIGRDLALGMAEGLDAGADAVAASASAVVGRAAASARVITPTVTSPSVSVADAVGLPPVGGAGAGGPLIGSVTIMPPNPDPLGTAIHVAREAKALAFLRGR